MKRSILILAAGMISLTAAAQEETKPSLQFSGYVEAYYSYDFDQPENHQRPGFLYNHNRHNELNLNLALLKAAYADDHVRGNLGIMAGTYAQYNLAAEPELLRHIYEANIGVRIGKGLWVDAGVMPSHIGFETAISKDCLTATRSLMAENTPYYEAGAKITWTPNDKWAIAAMYLNGWQRIKRPDANQTPGFGTQVTFKPTSKVTLNWSTFIGNDKPDSVRRMRYFNDVYGIFTISDKFTLIAGADYGLEQKEKGSSEMNTWYSPIIVAKYAFTDKIAMAARYEHYNDEQAVIIGTNDFRMNGYSLGLDIAPVSKVLFRIEGKLYDGKPEVFNGAGSNTSITTTLAISL